MGQDDIITHSLLPIMPTFYKKWSNIIDAIRKDNPGIDKGGTWINDENKAMTTGTLAIGGLGYFGLAIWKEKLFKTI